MAGGTTIQATAVTGSRLNGDQVELSFAAADGPITLALPADKLLELIGRAAQLNRQADPQAGLFVEVQAFAAAGFTLSGTEADDRLLSLQTPDGASFAFLFDRPLTRSLRDALVAAAET